MARVADRNYTTLALPDALVSRIDAFVQTNTWGYRNRGEVTAAAIREFLQRYAEPQSDAAEPGDE